MSRISFCFATVAPLLFCCGLAHAANKKKPAPKPAPIAWPAVILDHPFHVGDKKHDMFEHPKPDAPTFKRSFMLPPEITSGPNSFIYITVVERDIAPPASGNP